MPGRIEPSDALGLVRHLADPVRAKQAYRHLIEGPPGALEAVRDGLCSESGDVRMYCARVLDRLVDAESWPALVGLLDDNDPRVRLHTLHALGCDRCKQDGFRPAKADVLPAGLRLLQHDPIYHVRAMAVEVVGRFAHDDAEAARALETARDHDEAPIVRKKAGWYAPGGSIYRKGQKRKR